MGELSGLPYAEVKYNKNAKLVDPAEVDQLKSMLVDDGITDLIVISHGWNNDNADARKLYKELLANIKSQIDGGSGGGLPGRKVGVAGLFWPSKKFAESDLIPGGAASVSGDVGTELLEKQIDDLSGFFDPDDADVNLAAAKSMVATLDSDPASREVFFRSMRAVLGDPQDLDPDDREEIPGDFFDADDSDAIEELFDELRKPDPPGISTTSTGGAAAGFSLSGFGAGARRLLNYTTYYQMKKRGRKIGSTAVSNLLDDIHGASSGVRIHLVGHSFGGLLVTSAAWGGAAAPAPIPVATMSLLQAAFSHNGFAEDFHNGKDGRYRSVVTNDRVAGPLLITHTENDNAVGVAYALASRFARQDAAAFGVGGASDRFGGIGANGARHTPEAVDDDLLDTDEDYTFESGKVYNLLADDFISDHSDVKGKQVAHAIVEAIASAG